MEAPGELAAPDPAAFRATFETNLLGAVAVTAALLPLLRASARGRIVNVSSTMGSLADHADPASAYAGSGVPAYRAAALNSLTVHLAELLAPAGINGDDGPTGGFADAAGAVAW